MRNRTVTAGNEATGSCECQQQPIATRAHGKALELLTVTQQGVIYDFSTYIKKWDFSTCIKKGDFSTCIKKV